MNESLNSVLFRLLCAPPRFLVGIVIYQAVGPGSIPGSFFIFLFSSYPLRDLRGRLHRTQATRSHFSLKFVSRRCAKLLLHVQISVIPSLPERTQCFATYVPFVVWLESARSFWPDWVSGSGFMNSVLGVRSSWEETRGAKGALAQASVMAKLILEVPSNTNPNEGHLHSTYIDVAL